MLKDFRILLRFLIMGDIYINFLYKMIFAARTWNRSLAVIIHLSWFMLIGKDESENR